VQPSFLFILNKGEKVNKPKRAPKGHKTLHQNLGNIKFKEIKNIKNKPKNQLWE
jgi:hypothetical protein